MNPILLSGLSVLLVGSLASTRLLLSYDEETCAEIILKDNVILDDAISLYYNKDMEWHPRKAPNIYACSLKRVKSIRKDAESVYFNGMIFISLESGILDGDDHAWSVIIHELVHHLQYLDGKLSLVDSGELKECEVENEAYAIQKKYLYAIGSKWTIDIEDKCDTKTKSEGNDAT